MMVYLIKYIVCSGIFLGAYLLLAEHGKNHNFKRIILLLFLVLSMVIPLISFEVEQHNVGSFARIQITDQQSLIVERVVATMPDGNFDYYLIIYWTYAFVCCLFALKFFKNLYLVWKRIRIHEKIYSDDYNIVLMATPIAPHSFLNYIFLNQSEYVQGVAEEILVHESAHVKQAHSLDILLVEFLKIFVWFNPFLPFYKKVIQINHEFLADAHVVDVFDDIITYQQLLLFKSSQQPDLLLSSSFNYITIKKRLIMMTSKPSKKANLRNQLLLSLIIALVIFSFSNRIMAQTEPGRSKPATKSSKAKGLSAAELEKYKALENKYITLSENQKYRLIKGKVTEQDKATMKDLYLRMSHKQQQNISISFVKRPKPLPLVIPSVKQLEELKNPAVYGVWIDGKRVVNNILDQHEPSDFKQVFISKLYGAAKAGRTYTHQADLMTKKYYEDYIERNNANKEEMLMMMWAGIPSKDSH